MKMMKFSWLTMLALGLLTFSSCEKEDDHDHDHGHNEITINILEPGPDEVLADASDAHIHIEIEATDSNHDIDIVLHPDGNVDDKILDVHLHEHDQKVVFEQDLDLSSYPAGTKFHLEVEACSDHDCEEKVFADVEFSIQ
ncbi:hypothetical protein [Phaeodactylibacter luteus]|uniref:DUF4625 domain-containing protein n=1 Tax=Phaeodactylibacter luteus TaxID=1564516 RepID=A0A5C6RPY1_9BACT|nr:hypothetical protein [Phaeodactylibacter luteus]TXB64441.1 hypothetical protein FRY97_07005 [Phaeodactylibacter luteus]